LHGDILHEGQGEGPGANAPPGPGPAEGPGDEDDDEAQADSYFLRAMRVGPQVLVTIVVTVVSVLDPELIGGKICHRLRLSDQTDRREVMTLPIADLDQVQMAEDAQDRGTRLCATGSFVGDTKADKKSGSQGLRFQVKTLSETVTPCQLIGASPEEVAEANALIDRLAGGEGRPHDELSRHILSELHDILSIAHVKLSPRFRKCERLTLLQAASCGQLPSGTNARLSTFIVSDPGKGKKVLGKYAEVLAPRHGLVQPTEVSPAGFTASTVHKRDGWDTDPGVFIRASHGAVVIEDLHRLEPKYKNRFHGAMMSILEDGQVVTQKAAFKRYEATTALHMNGNRHSVIRSMLLGAGPDMKAKDLSVPPDVFNRIDIVAHMDSRGDSAEVAVEMAMHKHLPEDPELTAATRKRRRALQVLVARLRERISWVDIGPVSEQMGQAMRDCIRLVREYTGQVTGPMQHLFSAESLYRRMANTLQKLVAAAARLDGRNRAEERDVATAWDMLGFKLEVIRWVCGEAQRVVPLGTRKGSVQRSMAAQAARWKLVLKEFGGKDPVTAEPIALSLRCSTDLVEEELREKGLVDKHGFYTIPTEVEWEAVIESGATVMPAPPPKDGDETEEEIEEGPEQEPVDDGIKPVAAQYRPLVEAFQTIGPERKGTAGRILCQIAVSEQQVRPMLDMQTRGLHCGFDPEQVQVPDGLFEKWRVEGLLNEDLYRRTHFAVQMLVEWDHKEMFGELVKMLGERPALDRDRRHLLYSAAVRLNPYGAYVPWGMQEILDQVAHELSEDPEAPGEAAGSAEPAMSAEVPLAAGAVDSS
jgi:hypothetical protein